MLIYVGSEAIAAVTMNSTVFWEITHYVSETTRRFVGDKKVKKIEVIYLGLYQPSTIP
jgi:hypothetical protein